MKFGVCPLNKSAEGAVLAHSLRTASETFRKGRVLTKDDIAQLQAAGYRETTLVRLEPGDITEDIAGQKMADAVVADTTLSLGAAGTGRVNIYAAVHGLLVLPVDQLNAINAIDEAVTLSTIEPFASVEPGQLVATVKIIPFAVREDTLSACETAAKKVKGLFRIAEYRPQKIGLLQTTLANIPEKLVTKGEEVTAARLIAMGLTLDEALVCPHEEPAIRESLKALSDRDCDIALVLGASAVADRRDVVPSAITASGGQIEQLGMPVDPGNLTFLAHIGEMSVVGLPGSARSPRTHGSDWIVQRLVAGLQVSSQDIRAMGVGGLLKEIPGRPMPRTEASPPKEENIDTALNVAAIVLAAGQSRRMGKQNKLLAEIDGVPMVVRTVNAIQQSTVSSITVVLGHEAKAVEAVLAGRNLQFVLNPDFAGGLSTSLKRGLSVMPADVDAALICLGDMPRISSVEIERLIAAFAPNEGHVICVPTHNGKRGNPVLLGRRFFAEIQDIGGDVGAKYLIGAYPKLVQEVEMADNAVLLDIDTPEALARINE
ncbi:MAG: NTP transferase domain-containing protein [Alphaproteobacteria bacterium]